MVLGRREGGKRWSSAEEVVVVMMRELGGRVEDGVECWC